jgi:hypothetical protein
MQQRTIAVGAFEEPEGAAEAIRALQDAGFDREHVGLAVLQAPDGEDIPEADLHRVRIDETTGILAGGMLGGIAGWLLGAAAVAVPGLGALVAAGALVGALGGAGIGAAAGGLIGTLVDHGVSHEEAEFYHEQVRLGSTLVIVRDAGRSDEAQAIMRQHGARDYHTRPTDQQPRPTA